jgi:tetratricopeptide (TPR) repeat protein
MKLITFLLFLFFSLASNAQIATPGCLSAHTLLDHIAANYYWGTPAWQTMMDSALSICPTSAKGWGNKGIVYLMRGDIISWSKFYEKAIQYDPLFYLGNRAWHRMRHLRDYKGALIDFQKQDSLSGFASIYVSDVHNYILMGQCKQGLGDFSSALDYYNRSIEKQVGQRGEEWVGTYDYLIRGILKFKMDDINGALNDFNKQIKSYEALLDSYYYRGLVHRKLKQNDMAWHDFEKAKTLFISQGLKRWDSFVILPDEVYLSDIEEALHSLK